MSESGAVYQTTTVGYTYDTGGNRNGSGSAVRHGFLRIMNRHKISTRKWIEWVLLSVSLACLIVGLVTVLINIFSSNESPREVEKGDGKPSEVEKVDNTRGSLAIASAMVLAGLLLGAGWAWLRFFQRHKSPRGGMSGVSGQMMGGLNPSTDLLVGSTSQYGPVLTELPSAIKESSKRENPGPTLSENEEETRTLMPETSVAPSSGANDSVQVSG